MSDPMDLNQIKPAASFLLLGQRFVIDSYVTGNVVYDKIIYDNMKIKRMLPSTLDVLFSLGNDAAAQILKPELDQYMYSSNLSSTALPGRFLRAVFLAKHGLQRMVEFYSGSQSAG